MKLIIRDSNGEIREQEITADMEFTPSAGEQYFFTGVENYTFNLTSGDTTLDVHFLDTNGDRINVVLHNMAELIQQNDATDSFSLETAFGVSTNQMGDKAVDGLLNNSELESGEIVEALKDVLSMDGSTLAGGAVVDNFQALLDGLDETATGDVQNTAYNPLFDAVQIQDVDPVKETSSDRPDSHGDRDNSIERAEGSYGSETQEAIVIPDTTATPAPVVTITEDTNNDGTLVSSEMSGDTNYRVDIPEEAEDGDTLNLTVNGVTSEITIDQDMLDNGYNSSVTALEEGADLTVSATITDQAGNESESSSDSVTRAIELSSENESHTINFEENSGNDGEALVTSTDAANVVIVLDTSGSMRDDGGDGKSRLELAKESLEEMINTYKDFGGVNVRLTTFSTEGSAGTEWMSANEAIEAINALSAGGWTNYEDALFETYDNFSDAPNGEKSSVYFISDGTPTKENRFDADADSDSTQGISGSAVDDDYLAGWTEFLEDNAKELNVIGIGTGLEEDDPDFQRVAVDIGTIKTNVMVVEDVTELQETLVNSVTKEVEGNLFDNLSNEEGDVTLDSITFEDVTYGETDMPITTPGGATFNVDFTTGDFSYTAKASDFTEDKVEKFSVNASDESGDTTSFDVNIGINVDDGSLSFLDDVEAIDMDEAVAAGGDIHTINMDNETSQTLTVNAEDIITANDEHEMVILGNDGDIIDLEGEGWTRQESDVSLDGEEGTFDHYSSISTDGTSVDIYVNNDITVNTDDIF